MSEPDQTRAWPDLNLYQGYELSADAVAAGRTPRFLLTEKATGRSVPLVVAYDPVTKVGYRYRATRRDRFEPRVFADQNLRVERFEGDCDVIFEESTIPPADAEAARSTRKPKPKRKRRL